MPFEPQSDKYDYPARPKPKVEVGEGRVEHQYSPGQASGKRVPERGGIQQPDPKRAQDTMRQMAQPAVDHGREMFKMVLRRILDQHAESQLRAAPQVEVGDAVVEQQGMPQPMSPGRLFMSPMGFPPDSTQFPLRR